jgi:hypothetical protein
MKPLDPRRGDQNICVVDVSHPGANPAPWTRRTKKQMELPDNQSGGISRPRNDDLLSAGAAYTREQVNIAMESPRRHNGIMLRHVE